MSENEAKETMQDFEAELEASFRKINEGDILTGTVISVDEDAITLDLKYYAPGIIKADEVSNDPSFVIDEHIHPGDVLEATVIRRDDGEGNILLSMKEANEVLAWDKLKELLENETVVTVKVSEAVKAGAVAYLYGIRGFIPASQKQEAQRNLILAYEQSGDFASAKSEMEDYTKNYPNDEEAAREYLFLMTR